VDYRAYPDSPPIDRVGCFTNHLGGIDYSEAIAQQQAADAGSLPWILADPMRVATEHALRQLSSASHAYALSDEAPVE
jgi:hypothetical protein